MCVQGTPQTHGLQSTMSESTQLCKAYHHLMYHTLHPFPTCVMSDTSQVNKCQTMPQPKYNWKVPTLRVTLERVTKFVTHKWCYEAKVEESEKLLWVEARTPLPWAATATGDCCNIHLLLFSPHNIKIDSFPAWGKMLRAFVTHVISHTSSF